MTERFGDAGWYTLKTGSPVLDGALVAFDCRIVRPAKYGTHTVLFCEVVSSHIHDSEQCGLIYFDRKYFGLGALGT